MSIIYLEPAKFESKYAIYPGEIVFHRKLSDAAKVLIAAFNQIKNSAPNWVVVQDDLARRLMWGRDKMRKTMKELEHYGYLQITQERKSDTKVEGVSGSKKGSFKQNFFKFSMDADYKTEKSKELFDPKTKRSISVQALQPSTEFPSTDNPSSDTPSLPIPDKPKPGLKVMKALPVKSSSSKAMVHGASPKKPVAKSKERLFKRPDDIEDRFRILLMYEFGKNKEKLEENTASYLANKFPLSHLENCFFDVQGKIKKGQNIKNPIGLFYTLLHDEACPRGLHCNTNVAFAEQIKIDFQWHSLVIKDKYVYDSTNPVKDIPLTVELESFKHSLLGLYSSLYYAR